jgi:putative hydrolase of the HAD superfamily
LHSFTLYQPKNNIKNIIFDFAGVIVQCPYDEFIKKALPKLSKTEEIGRLADLIFKSKLWEQYDKGLPYSELQKKLCSLINSQSDIKCTIEEVDNLIQAIKDLMIPMEDTLLLIKQLKSAGMAIFGLTNMPKEIFDHLINHYAIFKLFSGIVASSYTGLAKPEKSIYEYTLAKYNLTADETIFLDDRSINLANANKLGIHTILFTNAQQTRELLNEKLNITLEKVIASDQKEIFRLNELQIIHKK